MLKIFSNLSSLAVKIRLDRIFWSGSGTPARGCSVFRPVRLFTSFAWKTKLFSPQLRKAEEGWGIYCVCVHVRRITVSVCVLQFNHMKLDQFGVIWAALPLLGFTVKSEGLSKNSAVCINCLNGGERLYLTCSFFFCRRKSKPNGVHISPLFWGQTPTRISSLWAVDFCSDLHVRVGDQVGKSQVRAACWTLNIWIKNWKLLGQPSSLPVCLVYQKNSLRF